MGQREDFVCDRYVSPSIKDLEHSHRNMIRLQQEFFNTDSQQKHHKIAMKLFHALLGFLILEWQKEDYVNALK